MRNSCIWGFKLAILLPFLIFDHDFVRKGCIWNFEITILPQCLTFGSFCAKRLCPTWEMSMFRRFFYIRLYHFICERNRKVHLAFQNRNVYSLRTNFLTCFVPRLMLRRRRCRRRWNIFPPGSPPGFRAGLWTCRFVESTSNQSFKGVWAPSARKKDWLRCYQIACAEIIHS